LRIQRRWAFEAGIAPTVEKEDARWNEGATVPRVSRVGAIDAFWMILFAVAWVRIPDRS
jgi:hypothetical protein